jgi:hypothetical protein
LAIITTHQIKAPKPLVPIPQLVSHNTNHQPMQRNTLAMSNVQLLNIPKNLSAKSAPHLTGQCTTDIFPPSLEDSS